jgi:hypothetical protein
LIDSFANILQPNNTREKLFPLPRLSNLQELNIDNGEDPNERFIYEHQEDEKFEANIPCCSICLDNYGKFFSLVVVFKMNMNSNRL